MSADVAHKIQSRLLMLAAIFLGLFALALTISPAVRARSWEVDYRWSHWVGYLVWLGGYVLLHHATHRWLPHRDPYILPIIAVLSGWGLLTIWRLTTYYGMRQTIWLALALMLLILGLRLPSDLSFLRRYKYVLLTGGLLLTGLSLIFGTNPMGYGPRLWLGCCGIYLQPSEPLKLLLIVFLAAYFADWQSVLLKTHKSKDTEPFATPMQSTPKLQILIPTLVMTGVALLLLLVQRDLGTASIFIFIFAMTVYLATSWRWIPVITLVALTIAGVIGYWQFDVVRLRIDAWLNPWLDPAGRSYQIVQSLIAVANGGIFGRGPGLGSPTLVPVSHSDFIFAAIGEETGLIGMIGLLVLLALLLHRGTSTALKAITSYHRLLAAGLTAFLVIQSVLIIGGNLRLLPLTGVTLPLVSYGGSSLMVSLLVALLLLHISAHTADQQTSITTHSIKAPLIPIAAFLLMALTATAIAAGWWAYLRSPDLISRTDNPRRAISDRYVYRGSLLGRTDSILVKSTGQTGSLTRIYDYPGLGPVTGYNHPVYGQAGLEASLDPTLRGIEGNDPLAIWWNHLIYGQPPPGLDVRLTIDMKLQTLTDDLFSSQKGALILLNAKTGEILVMASHPGFDPNQLDNQWEMLIQDPEAPLINRATQGIYPLGDLAEQPFMQAVTDLKLDRVTLRLPLADVTSLTETTPLEMAFAAATLSNDGSRPAARLALSYHHPKQGWVVFSTLGTTVRLLSPQEASSLVSNYQSNELPIWEIISLPMDENLTWYLAGTLLEPRGVPFTLALVLEERDAMLAKEIGQAILSAAMGP